MIKINLSPSPKKAKAAKAKPAKPGAPQIKLPAVKLGALYILGIAVVVIIIAIFLIIQSSKIGNLNRNVSQLQTRLDELKIYVATVDSLKQREKELLTLINPIKELNQNRFLIAHILDEISARIPEFTWLTALNISTTNIDLKGMTASNLLVAEFMNRLEESPYIGNVDLVVLEKKTIEKQEMMEFTLTANVKIDSTGGSK
jgi:Tfp pilus assembly protein PilN|uniref:PilN domain-containing protein n=1 Tax=candidate division WOR-3 bacterium TaxID=2052148 RepID=A0A7C4TFK6_UNCW3